MEEYLTDSPGPEGLMDTPVVQEPVLVSNHFCTQIFPGLPVSCVFLNPYGVISLFCKIADACLGGDFDAGDDRVQIYG
jgi:hypothetical protein